MPSRLLFGLLLGSADAAWLHTDTPSLSLQDVKARIISVEALGKGRDELAAAPAGLSDDDLPEAFDAREAWGADCPSTADIYDQSNCGDCWAVSTVTTATDRMCIAQLQQGANRSSASDDGTVAPQVRLSVEHMVGCCTTCGFGCGEGFPNYGETNRPPLARIQTAH